LSVQRESAVSFQSWSSVPRRKRSNKVTRSQDCDAAPRAQLFQFTVPRDDHKTLPVEGEFQKLIVVRVAAIGGLFFFIEEMGQLLLGETQSLGVCPNLGVCLIDRVNSLLSA
jgi:hypothetical protein